MTGSTTGKWVRLWPFPSVLHTKICGKSSWNIEDQRRGEQIREYRVGELSSTLFSSNCRFVCSSRYHSWILLGRNPAYLQSLVCVCLGHFVCFLLNYLSTASCEVVVSISCFLYHLLVHKMSCDFTEYSCIQNPINIPGH